MSEAAKVLVVEIQRQIAQAMPSRSKPRKSGHIQQREAIAALIADLLWAAKVRPTYWSALSLRSKTFTGQPISRRTFRPVFDAMVTGEWIDWKPGSHKRLSGPEKFMDESADVDRPYTGHIASKANDSGNGMVSRIRANSKLFDLAAEFAITAQTVDDHFSRRPPTHVLELRRSKAGYQSDPSLGRVMSFETSDKTKQLAKEITDINDYLSRFKLESCPHRGFYRVFNCGDAPDFKWNKGGRLYSHERDGSYQLLPESKRLQIRIGGSSVAEIDLKASYLTILYGLMNAAPTWTEDPYHVPGLRREVVKHWITITLGSAEFHDCWPRGTSNTLKNVIRRTLSKDFPIQDVKAAVLQRHPILKSYFRSKLTVFDLMYKESEIIIGAMVGLRLIHNVPSLPVHDSIIVPERFVPQAEETLLLSFRAKTGVVPTFTTTFADGRVTTGGGEDAWQGSRGPKRQ